MQAKQIFAAQLLGLCLAVVLAVATFSAQAQRSELVDFPQSDLDMIAVMQSLAPQQKQQQLAAEGMNKGSGGVPFPIDGVSGPAPKAVRAAPKAPKAKAVKPSLTMAQQYARIEQNQGYFAPWSRVNSWTERVAINNIRKNNTPAALAAKAKMIATENAKFARKFKGPNTSQYTGMHLSQDQILDPKYSPWGNGQPRKAYFQGF